MTVRRSRGRPLGEQGVDDVRKRALTDAENEEHRRETASEQEPEASGNQEAAKYRRRLREAEAERDKLTGPDAASGGGRAPSVGSAGRPD